MKVQLINNNYFDGLKDACISVGDKKLIIRYGGNLDLYWSIYEKNPSRDELKSSDITITKENYGVYELFEKLFYAMENITLYDDSEFYEPEDIEHLKESYRKYNRSNYNNLYDGTTITWYSDETNEEVANFLKIRRDDESFNVSFYTQPHKGSYDEDTHHYDSITVRFRNSGSRYDPFNIFFMQMYNALANVDDVLDEGHQIHMEEYLYERKRTQR